mgnify:CR=1 FL=1
MIFLIWEDLALGDCISEKYYFWIQKLYSMGKICYNLCTHYAV